MSLLDTMNKLGQFARKGARALAKPINFTIATVALATALSFNAQGQTQADTLWAQGDIIVTDYLTGNPIANANTLMIPDSVENHKPDTTFQYISNSTGTVSYNVIAGIDTTTGINEETKQDNTKIFPTVGSDASIFFKDFEKGNVNVYSLSGQLVSQNSFFGNEYYLNMSGLSSGMYIINVRTEDGDVFTQKFMKTNNSPVGQASRPNFDEPVPTKNLKMAASSFTAKYKIKVEAAGYQTDSVFSYFTDGPNGPMQLSLTPLSSTLDTLWGSGLIGVLNSTNNQQIDFVDLTFIPDTVPLITPDTSWNFQSYPGGAYNIPVFIGTQLPGSSTATYRIQASEPGFYPLDTLIDFSNGNNPNTFLYFNPAPPSVINTSFNAWELFDTTAMENALVYIQDGQGNIDSLRTDSNGNATFVNVGQGQTYTVGIGKEHHKGWEGFTITTPTSGTYLDTITITKNYTLIPDTIFSALNNVDVYVSAIDYADMFEAFHIQQSLYDTSNFSFGSGFSSIQINGMTNWLNNLGAASGKNFAIKQGSFYYPQNMTGYDPYTTNPDSVGTIINVGSSNCYSIDYGMPTGEDVRVGATQITNAASVQENFEKEILREEGYEEVSGRSSVMNPNPAPYNDIDNAIVTATNQLGINRYRLGKHDLGTLQYLTDNSSILPVVAPQGGNGNKSSFIPLKPANATVAPINNYWSSDISW